MTAATSTALPGSDETDVTPASRMIHHRPMISASEPLPAPGDRPTSASSERVAVRRRADRGRYDAAAVHAVLDAGRVAHVGFVDGGQPFVLPMAYGRHGDRLILHGSRASRVMRRLASGAAVCVTVTHLDGLVLARSAFHHSLNYRSVMVFGTARPIEDEVEQRSALDALVEHLVPGRTADARSATALELRQTLLAEVAITEASVKVRTGGPIDDPADLDLPVWAGVVPLAEAAGPPEPDPAVPPSVTVPEYLIDRSGMQGGGGGRR